MVRVCALTENCLLWSVYVLYMRIVYCGPCMSFTRELFIVVRVCALTENCLLWSVYVLYMRIVYCGPCMYFKGKLELVRLSLINIHV